MPQDFHELRRSLSLKQTQIADVAGIRASVISEWERGHILSPRYGGLERVSIAMGISVSALVDAIRESYWRAHPGDRPHPPDLLVAA